MKSMRQDLGKKLEEKGEEISKYKREISTLRENMMYMHPTIPSSTSSAVARGISALVCKYILFVRFVIIVSLNKLSLQIKNPGGNERSKNMPTPSLDDSGKFKYNKCSCILDESIYSYVFILFNNPAWRKYIRNNEERGHQNNILKFVEIQYNYVV